MTFDSPKVACPPLHEANERRSQKRVVIGRQTNRWPFGENTGLFGGSLMWAVEALAKMSAESAPFFQLFNDAFDLPVGVRTTRLWKGKDAIAVPRWSDDLIDFLLEQRTTYSASAEVMSLHPSPRRSAVQLNKNLNFESAHRAFTSHFQWRPFITDAVDEFCKQASISQTETLGVHYRGTDKPGSAEANLIEPQLLSKQSWIASCDVIMAFASVLFLWPPTSSHLQTHYGTNCPVPLAVTCDFAR